VPPLSLALRGGSLLYVQGAGMNNERPLQMPNAEQIKLGFGAYGPNGVQGQSPWP